MRHLHYDYYEKDERKTFYDWLFMADYTMDDDTGLMKCNGFDTRVTGTITGLLIILAVALAARGGFI